MVTRVRAQVREVEPLRLPLTELPRPAAWPHLGRYELAKDNEGRGFFHLVELAPRESDLTGLDLVKALLNFDLRDPEAVLDFVEEFGITSVALDGYATLGLEPEKDLPPDHWWHRLPPIPPEVRDMRHALSEIHRRSELLGQPILALVDEAVPRIQAEPFGLFDEYVSEFALGVDTLRAFLACHQELSGRRFAPGRLASSWPPFSAFQAPATRAQAERRLEAWLRRGLSELSLTVSTDRMPSLRPPRSLYSLLCLEILNHITSGRPLLVCANERCGRIFSRQEGSSRYGGHRSDVVRYCSASCSQAQMQREYRRRLKARRSKKGGTRAKEV
jgi:hypothetical protein